MIAIIDYGMGNLKSVSKALKALNINVEVTNKINILKNANGIILPGVGSFSRGMQNLNNLKLSSFIKKTISTKKPFLGICLGMQLLFTYSYEHGKNPGLNILEGKVIKFPSNKKIPHMGWNQIKKVSFIKSQNIKLDTCKMQLFKNIPDNCYFYFAHSYYVLPENKEIIAAVTNYSIEFACTIQKDNIFGVQFHPEKSSDLGLEILKNFVNLTKK